MKAFLIVILVFEIFGLMRARAFRDGYMALSCGAMGGWAIYLLTTL